jgi:PEGA domain
MKARALALVVCILAGGCATVLKGRTDQIAVVSDPQGARVTVNGEYKGLSPVTFAVPSDRALDIQVTKDGYQSEQVENLPSDRSGYELMDLLSGLFPLLIDRTDGASMGHETTTTVVRLKPLPPLGSQ